MNITLNNGMEMPEIGLGVYKLSETEMTHAIQAALEAGYRAFDTAYFYFNEKALGSALKNSGIPREELFITTKLWNDDQGYEQTKVAFYRSLEALDTDYIDLYLIHWPCPEDDLYVESYRAMEELYNEGKVRALGVCNFKAHHLEKLMSETTIKPVVNQIEYHPYFNQHELQQFCEQHDIKITAWSPLMRGGELFDLPQLMAIAEQHNKSVAQILIRWHVQSGRIVIPKSSNPERIKSNIDIYDFELTADNMQRIDALNKGQRQFKDPDLIKIGDMK